MPTLDRAIAIAAEAHAGQVDRLGEPSDLPPCTECGACCIEAGPVRIDLDTSTDRMVPRYLTRSVRNTIGFASYEAEDARQMAKHIGGRCKALKGEAMKDCRCGIYDRRPSVCKGFPRGSDQCLFSRRVATDKLRDPLVRRRGYGPDWRETV